MKSDEKIMGSPQRRVVLREIKQSSGLSVPELAERLDLSYMGAKQHCLVLEKKGYLTSRNQHNGAGRPRLIYRLTPKGQAAFDSTDGGISLSLLRQARTLFGPTAPGKLLYLHFQDKTAACLEKIPRELPVEERLKKLAELRSAEGCMSRVEENGLLEYHCPWSPLYSEFPEALAMEEGMMAKAAGLPLRRRQIDSGGVHYEIRFEV